MNEEKVEEVKGWLRLIRDFPIEYVAHQICQLFEQPEDTRPHGGEGVSTSGVGGENPDSAPFPNVEPSNPQVRCNICGEVFNDHDIHWRLTGHNDWELILGVE